MTLQFDNALSIEEFAQSGLGEYIDIAIHLHFRGSSQAGGRDAEIEVV